MILTAVMVSGNQEYSTEVLSATKARLMLTSSVTRITESMTWILNTKGWTSIRGQKADSLESHLLDYALSLWHVAGGQAKANLIKEALVTIAHPYDLEDQRQTNSFQGRNWK
jgi:hypothetical protein